MLIFTSRKYSSLTRRAKEILCSGVFECGCNRCLCGIENQDTVIAERYFGWLPSEALVILPGIIPCWFPFLIEPSEIRFVIGYPFLDGLPGRFDGLHGFDVEGRRRRAGKVDDTLPESVETKEEFDLAGAQVGAHGFHDAVAAGALERVATPDLEDEISPKGTHVAGPAFGRGGDE